jgi:hypothetical protein
VSLEILNYKKNGDKFWNLLSMMPVCNAAGAVVSFIGVQSDITELIRRKHAERELQQAKVLFIFQQLSRSSGFSMESGSPLRILRAIHAQNMLQRLGFLPDCHLLHCTAFRGMAGCASTVALNCFRGILF